MVRRYKASKRVRAKRSAPYKRRSRQVTTNYNRAMRPFPARFITKMKYAEQVNVVGGTGSGFTSYRFNLNSIYDPIRS